MKKIEIVLSIENLLDLGGTIEKGTKLITHPNIGMGINTKSVTDTAYTKEYTFVELVEGEGVKVEETDSLLGTGWLFTTAEVTLANE